MSKRLEVAQWTFIALCALLLVVLYWGIGSLLAKRSAQSAIAQQQAQASWQQACDGVLRVWHDNNNLQVACDSAVITPTATLQPTPTITLQPTTTITPTATLEPTPTITPTLGAGFVVDHNSVALFDRIPPEYLQAARGLRLLFSDRSVGQNINESLACLTAASWAASPSSCRKDYYDTQWHNRVFTLADWNAGTVPDRITFYPDPNIYNRSNWSFVFKAGTWSELTGDFIQVLAPAYVDSKDVLTYQFSYLNVLEGMDIANFFYDNPNKYDIYDLEQYIAQHPDKTFVFWTTSLARGIGSQTAANFNQQMRLYATANNKILMDMADIEAYTDIGVPCYDNRDGVQYCNVNGCENYPSDNLDLPAICQDWTTETDGGHLGSVSGGLITMAKAMWVLMARIAGWDGQ